MGTLLPDMTPVDKMLRIKRIKMDISYHNSECQVLYFTDISDTKQLKMEQEKTKMLKTINTLVHHEMLSPLKSNVVQAEKLLQKLKGKYKLMEMA